MQINELVEQTHRLLLDYVPPSTRTPSGWYTFDCVMCTDRRKRAGIKVDKAKIRYNCFNCGFTAGWRPGFPIGQRYKLLAETLGCDRKLIQKTVFDLIRNHEQLLNSPDVDVTVTMGTNFKEKHLPDDAVLVSDLPDSDPVRQYAQQRCLLGVYPFIVSKNMPQRLIVPFTFNGRIVGWTARLVNSCDTKSAKYLSESPKGYVFNIDSYLDTPRKTVIVTEGVLDAALVSGVSVLGNTVNAEQAHLIEKLNMRVVLCPDRDQAGRQLIKKAAALGWSVSFPPWDRDCKDAADAVKKYGRVLTVQSILDYATDSTVKIQVQSKLKKNLYHRENA